MLEEENINSKYISLIEASKDTPYGQEYLSLRARQGKLKAVKFGRNWVTTKEWVSEYLSHVEDKKNNNNGVAEDTNIDEPSVSPISRPTDNNEPIEDVIVTQKNYGDNEQLAEVIEYEPYLTPFGVRPTSSYLLSERINAEYAKNIPFYGNEFFSEKIPVKPRQTFALSGARRLAISFATVAVIIGCAMIGADAAKINVAEKINSAFAIVVGDLSTPLVSVYDDLDNATSISRSLNNKQQNAVNIINRVGLKIKNSVIGFGENIDYAAESFGDGTMSIYHGTEKTYYVFTASVSSSFSQITKRVTDFATIVGDKINGHILTARQKLFALRDFIIAPWRWRPGGTQVVISNKEDINRLEKEVQDLKEKGIVSKEITKEVSRITIVESVKEITREIVKVDSTALAQLRAQVMDVYSWKADIENLKNITKQLELTTNNLKTSSIIYAGGFQSPGPTIVYSVGAQLSGFGDLGVSHSTTLGTNADDQLTVNSRSRFNAPVIIASSITQTGTSPVIFGGLVSATNGLNVTGAPFTVGGSNFTVDLLGNVVALGNVGIGTTNPTGSLMIVGGDTILGNGIFNNPSASEDLYITGNAEVDGTLYTAGISTAGHILPATDNTYDLGSSALRWRDIWLGRDAYINGSVGIGTTSPLQKFQINNTATSAFVVTSAGNVGIGVTNPLATFHNAGSTLFSTLEVGDLPTGGNIGAATDTIDRYTSFNVSQITLSQAITLPAPTNTTAGRVAFVSNTGTTPFSMYNNSFRVGYTAQLVWDGNSWNISGGPGTDKGTINNSTLRWDATTQAWMENTSVLSQLNPTVADSFGLRVINNGAVIGPGYGSYVTKTGASTTNVAGYFSATGATNNYGLIIENGYVGIGTTSPTFTLDVNGTQRVVTSVSSPLFQGDSGAVTFGNVAQSTTITGSTLSV
ncbi:MAG: hypothetical protein V1905_01375, partial [bacterium]